MSDDWERWRCTVMVEGDDGEKHECGHTSKKKTGALSHITNKRDDAHDAAEANKEAHIEIIDSREEEGGDTGGSSDGGDGGDSGEKTPESRDGDDSPPRDGSDTQSVTTENNDTDNPLLNMPEEEESDSNENCPDCETELAELPEGAAVRGKATVSGSYQVVEFQSDGADHVCPSCDTVVMEDGTVVR